jgi:hypothetical protein
MAQAIGAEQRTFGILMAPKPERFNVGAKKGLSE